ncbi:unnamed protein product [Moneuplotes crassus]|uniref:Phosphatidic acid phosphatase type 2/haloperoxidase domain-containing protein n=1 Tax=Euplotes crassus TaxID=5936 RepID=A0AAD1UFI6_EUPCR|nr:unnamed protein product [Moneuplotes crassus]
MSQKNIATVERRKSLAVNPSQTKRLISPLKLYNNDSSTSSEDEVSEERNEHERREEYSVQIDGMKIALVAILVMIFGLILKESMSDYEISLIYALRGYSSHNHVLEIICSWVLVFTDLNFIEYALVAIYLFSDPLLAYKSTFLMEIQIFFVAILKLISTSPRPCWIEDKMNVHFCSLDYSGPSDHICVGAQFYTYIAIIFFYKYAEEKSLCLITGLLILIYIFIFLTGFSLFYLAQTFIFECFAGIIYCILIVVTFIRLDKIIQRYCTSLCFDNFQSRRKKFTLLFSCIGAFLVILVYYKLSIDDLEIESSYLRSNSLKHKKFNYKLGMDYTFFDLSKIFTLIGATFGACFASSNIEGYLSQDTPTQKRVIRTILGLGLMYGLNFLSSLIPVDNYLTDYCLRKILPNILVSYAIYGLFPYSWKYIRLIEVYQGNSTETDASFVENKDYASDRIDEASESKSEDEYKPPRLLQERDNEEEDGYTGSYTQSQESHINAASDDPYFKRNV